MPDHVSTYRLDRRAVMPVIGLELIGAGLATVVAFLAWGPLGVLAGILLLHAVSLTLLPPTVARTDPEGARLGGRMTVKPVRLRWQDVDDVSVDRGAMLFDRGTAGTLSFPLAYVGPRANALVHDVYDRLNAANGYRRFDPTTD